MNAKKVVLITGASSGIGKATAIQLLGEGYTVYGAARRIEKMRDLEKLGVHLLEMDVTNDESMKQGINRIISENARIDALINNAGYGSYGAIEDVPIEEARYQFEVNVFGLGRLSQLVVPYMRNQKTGKIVNVSSIGGKVYMPFGGWYHSTKHAVEGLSDSLRMELAPFGIDVIIIEPGPIKTEWEGIAADHLMKTSGSGYYASEAKQFNGMLRQSYEGNNASMPEVIAATISKALMAGKPKTRYAAGKMAKLLIFVRWLVSDRMFDSVLASQLKSRGEKAMK